MKFKIGDKVKIPKSKSPKGHGSYIQFLEEFRKLNYSKDYLIIESIYDFRENGGELNYHAKPEGISAFNRSAFLESDLELYEEPNQVSFKTGDKVRFLGKEAAKNSFYDKAVKFSLDLEEGQILTVKSLTSNARHVDKFLSLKEAKYILPIDIFELVKEEQTMNKKFKNRLKITGSKHLLEAFAKELVELGYKVSDDYYNYEATRHILTTPEGVFGYYTIHNQDHTVNLPTDWEKGLELAKEINPSKFEQGKWYYTNDDGCVRIFKFKSLESHDSYNRIHYSICVDSKSGKWQEDMYIANNEMEANARLATQEEVRDVLIAETKKRGFAKGVKYKEVDKDVETTVTRDIDTAGYYPEYDSLECNFKIYKDGKWGEIIVDKTPKITVSGYTAEFKEDHVVFGCARFDVAVFKQARTLANVMSLGSMTNRTLDSIKLGAGTFTIDQVNQIVEYYNFK